MQGQLAVSALGGPAEGGRCQSVGKVDQYLRVQKPSFLKAVTALLKAYRYSVSTILNVSQRLLWGVGTETLAEMGKSEVQKLYLAGSFRSIIRFVYNRLIDR